METSPLGFERRPRDVQVFAGFFFFLFEFALGNLKFMKQLVQIVEEGGEELD